MPSNGAITKAHSASINPAPMIQRMTVNTSMKSLHNRRVRAAFRTTIRGCPKIVPALRTTPGYHTSSPPLALVGGDDPRQRRKGKWNRQHTQWSRHDDLIVVICRKLAVARDHAPRSIAGVNASELPWVIDCSGNLDHHEQNQRQRGYGVEDVPGDALHGRIVMSVSVFCRRRHDPLRSPHGRRSMVHPPHRRRNPRPSVRAGPVPSIHRWIYNFWCRIRERAPWKNRFDKTPECELRRTTSRSLFRGNHCQRRATG
jgi:hypothetical protein